MHPCYSLHSSDPLPPLPPPPPVTLFSMSASPLLLCKQICQDHPSRFHNMRLYTIFVFLFLIYFTSYNRL